MFRARTVGSDIEVEIEKPSDPVAERRMAPVPRNCNVGDARASSRTSLQR